MPASRKYRDTYDPASIRPRPLRSDAHSLDPVVLEWAWLTETAPREKTTLVTLAGWPGADLSRLMWLTGMGRRPVLESLEQLGEGGLVYLVNDGHGFAVTPHTTPAPITEDSP